MKPTLLITVLVGVLLAMGASAADKLTMTTESDAEKIAWKNGWIAYSIDAEAVDSYHRMANDLPDDSDPVALAKLWENICGNAASREKAWNALTDKEKLDYPIRAFWKAGKGEPRRLSRSQTTRMIDALK